MKTRHGLEEWTAGSFGRQRRRRHETGGRSCNFPFSSFLGDLYRGAHIPRCARMRAEDSLCCDPRLEPRSVSFVFPFLLSTYLFGVKIL
jgi:hypothetical protein